MSKDWNPKKRTVELQEQPKVSRIRRDPALADANLGNSLARKVKWRSSEWEIRVVVVGVALFALAFAIIWGGVLQYYQ